MAAAEHNVVLEELELADRRPPDFFRSAAQVAEAPITGYSHVLRRAWKDFDALLGVFSVDGRPTIYLQRQGTDGPISRADQRRFWSHGIAPILVRVAPQEIRIYSGLCAPAVDEQDVDGANRLIRVLQRTNEMIEFREFVRSVEAGTVYDRHADHFDPTQAVDQQLVRNLRAAREQLSAKRGAPNLPTIHRLLGRVLFTCYLEARGALKERDFGQLGAGAGATFKEILNLPESKVRDALDHLFRRLARYFRGDLFGDDVRSDLRSLRDCDVVTLRRLVTARNDLASGQLVLPFDVYDFGVIPIETISAVYEDFIRAEDPEAQQRRGAYYTPPKLVEFATDLATEHEPDLTGKRVLDPGCGSGAFLVSLFNRMAEAWVRRNERARNGTRAAALARILREQIRGVDVDTIACQATCFSLYMAMLDFLNPREIRNLGPEGLPSLLTEGTVQPRPNCARTIVRGDFLSSLPALDGEDFDLIVGNPPWVARGNVEKSAMAEWTALHPGTAFPVPAGQMACAFIWEAPRYLRPEGRGCFVLPAGVLFGDQTDAFQAKWFSQHRVEKIAQLSDLRFFLFPGAVHPAIVARFRRGAPMADHRVNYLTPKASGAALFDNAVPIEVDDRKAIKLQEILFSALRDDAPALWLKHNWASARDRELLGRLLALPKLGALAGAPRERKRWIKGQGFKPHGERDETPKQPFWGPGHPFLDAQRRFRLLVADSDVTPVDPSFQKLHRAPDERLFRTPFVVFNQGFSNIAFAPFDIVFRHALQSIAGPPSDRDLLMFLTATLLSPLAEYFAFHLTTKPIYRGKSLLNEVLRFPFPLPQHAPGRDPRAAVSAVADIFARVLRDRRFGTVGHDDLIRAATDETVPHVYSYFDVSPDELILIDDTVHTLRPSATPSRGSHIPTLAVPSRSDRALYASTLIDTLYAWAGGNGADLRATCVVSNTTGVAVLTVGRTRDAKEYYETEASADMDNVLQRLKALLPERRGSLLYLRNAGVFDQDRMHVVKPLTMRYWMRSAALNDADAAAAHLLSRRPKTVRT
jgi:hypothetical protein